MTTVKTQEDLQNWSQISQLAEDDPNKAEAAYYAYFGSQDYWEQRLPYDLWTTAFFAPIEKGQPVPTTQDVRQAKIDHTLVSKDLKEFAKQLAKRYHFLHWHFEFPELFDDEGKGGFDVVLGNPPWEKINLKDEEYFAFSHPKIAQAKNKSKRKALIKELELLDAKAYTNYLAEQAYHDQLSKFFRYSSKYPETGTSRVNLFSIFSELGVSLLVANGIFGGVIASGIVTDDNNKLFFERILREKQLISVFDFENRRKLFPAVDSRMKFCLLIIGGHNISFSNPVFAFFLTSTEDLNKDGILFSLTYSDILKINPNSRTCPIFRNSIEAGLGKKIYSIAPAWDIQSERTGFPGNPKTPFNMSNDSHLFNTYEQLISGKMLSSGVIDIGNDSYLPLYEAKFIHQFDHRYATYQIKDINSGANEASQDLLTNPKKGIIPLYWMQDSVHYERNLGNWYLVYRMITNATNERTMIASIIPNYPCGHSLSIIEGLGSQKALHLLGNLNSIVFDFSARQKVAGSNFNHWILKQLPVAGEEILTRVNQFITPRLLELVFTSWNLLPFANKIWDEANDNLQGLLIEQRKKNAEAIGIDLETIKIPDWLNNGDNPLPFPPFIWDQSRRFRLRCDLDAIFGHLYSLTKDEFAYILDTFPIVKRKDEAEYGEYRTKRMILEEFDKLADDPMLEGVCVPLSERVSVLEHLDREQPAPPKRSEPVVQKQAASAPQPVVKEAPKPEKRAKSPKVLENQTNMFGSEADFSAKKTDWSRYRCKQCGTSVMGFSMEEHTRNEHGGKDPGYEKIG